MHLNPSEVCLMPRLHFVIPARGNPLWGGVLLLAAIGCSDERSSAGPSAVVPLADSVGLGQNAPLDFSYVCGNRFLVYSTYNVPISVRYRVAESGEEGTVEVAAAPSDDPPAIEQIFETRTRGTVQIFFKGKPIVARTNTGAVSPPPSEPAPAVMASALASQWSAPFTWVKDLATALVAVHMMLLPNGRVLSIGLTRTPHVWDPGCGIGSTCFTQTSPPAGRNLFCAGHALLSDGRVLLAGGHIDNGIGIRNITLFKTNVSTNTYGWTSATVMNAGRWYPTTTIMNNGEVVILGGSKANPVVGPEEPEYIH